jgi:hypothetical protein
MYIMVLVFMLPFVVIAQSKTAPKSSVNVKNKPTTSFSMNDLKGNWKIDIDREWNLRKDQFDPTANPEFLKQHVYIPLPPPWSSLITLADLKEERFAFSNDGLSRTSGDGKTAIVKFKSFTIVGPNTAMVVTEDKGIESTVKINRIDAKTIHLTEIENGKDKDSGILMHRE